MANIGDTIVVGDNSGGSFYKAGARGKVVQIDHDGDVWADFRNMGNPFGSFDESCDGTWCLSADRYTVVES